MPQPTISGAIGHPLVRKILDYQGAMARGDLAQARNVFAADVIYTVPGGNVFSGIYRGPDAVMGYLGRLMEATAGSYEITAMVWLVCGDKVVLQTDNRAQRGGRSLQWKEAVLFEFRDGLKWRIDLFQAQQAEVDAFFGH